MTRLSDGATTPDAILHEARRLVAAGLSVIPIRPDGSKRPTVPWKLYQMRLPTDAELVQWFQHQTVGLAIIGGAVSGHVEILDFEEASVFERFSILVEELCPGLITRLPLTETPADGRHCPYRCEQIEGNLKLAQRLGPERRPEVLVETRGEAGYAIIPPSPAACHPLKRPYMLLRGDLAAIPTITPEERRLLLNATRAFNTYVKPERAIIAAPSHRLGPKLWQEGGRPGDDYNARAEWASLLQAHGWTCIGHRGEITLWRRPGKAGSGISATENYAGSDVLYVFSSNAYPFEPETAYSKFAAYALLEHDGDFIAAARALAARGYGEPGGDRGRGKASYKTGLLRSYACGRYRSPAHDPWLGPREQRGGLPTEQEAEDA
jgi:putative DNA primase/helicase